jgi:MFS family permease
LNNPPDGLEIQIVSQISTVLAAQGTLHFTVIETGYIASSYLFGEVIGALLFGRITDQLGRKKLFLITLALYMIANAIAAFSPNLYFLLFFRFLSGMGIGGEYTAINSAIDELIPPYYRGRVDIGVNGTYWAGAAVGAAANMLLLNPHVLPADLGWRFAFFLGPTLGLGIIFLRRAIPESPRWLMTHGRQVDAELIVDKIETRIRSEGVELQPIPKSKALVVTGQGKVSYRQIGRTMWREYRSRSILGLSLMASQMFLYNAVFFTDGTTLVNFYHVGSGDTSKCLIWFALGNLAGPLVLGTWFDTIGRRKMITSSYCLSGLLMAVNALLFHRGSLDATTQTIFWCVSFFFASTGASAAYLTVSEIFPVELRAQAVSFFFVVSLLLGGVAAPPLFAYLVGGGINYLTAGYCAAGVVMTAGGIIAWRCGVNAERKPLERIARPLSAVPIEPSLESP